MYDNIGGKIKGFAIAAFIIEAIAAVLIGISFLTLDDESLYRMGLLIAIFGPIVAWFSSWFIYGFGELVDTNGEIARNTYEIAKNTYEIARNTYGSERESE